MRVWLADVEPSVSEPRALDLAGSASSLAFSPTGRELVVALAPTAPLLLFAFFALRAIRAYGPTCTEVRTYHQTYRLFATPRGTETVTVRDKQVTTHRFDVDVYDPPSAEPKKARVWRSTSRGVSPASSAISFTLGQRPERNANS